MHESDKFNDLFEQITYLKGGVGTGFKHVEETAYAARLLRVRGIAVQICRLGCGVAAAVR